MKTNELTGNALNWAVNHVEGLTGVLSPVNYCGKWEHGGPIIEREKIAIDFDGAAWCASDNHKPLANYGPTPLIAAMRCYVASKLGEDVSIPEELK
jgi:hypothetical protein